MSDRYDEWYASQQLKGRNMGGVLPPDGGNHDRHPGMDRGRGPGGLVDHPPADDEE